MKLTKLALLSATGLLSLACTCSLAQDDRKGRTGPYFSPQVSAGNGVDNVDWQEEHIAPPPVFSVDRLIALDMPQGVSLKIGVDPETIVVGADGVVRYVIAMRNNTGSTNAVYEGIRCITDEVKTYARQGSSGQWSMVQSPVWKAVNDNMPSHHAQAFARQGGCQNRLAVSKEEIVTALKNVRRATPGAKTN
jgi:hypothetical protein